MRRRRALIVLVLGASICMCVLGTAKNRDSSLASLILGSHESFHSAPESFPELVSAIAIEVQLPFGIDKRPRRDPECPLASPNSTKEIKIVIVPHSTLQTRPPFHLLNHDLTKKLTESLRAGFKANRENVCILANEIVQKYTAAHPNWWQSGAEELGKALGADYVIQLEPIEF